MLSLCFHPQVLQTDGEMTQQTDKATVTVRDRHSTQPRNRQIKSNHSTLSDSMSLAGESQSNDNVLAGREQGYGLRRSHFFRKF